MTEATKSPPRHWALLFALMVAGIGAVFGGCARDEYYCDNTGCYFCDGAGCRSVAPPNHPSCRGDDDCSAGQICTSTGCATRCQADRDCAQGWACRQPEGLCLAPREPTPTPMPAASCRTSGDCTGGSICIDGMCRRSESPACRDNADCTNGNVCVSGRCVEPSLTCQFDNQCGVGRACVNAECRVRCGGTVGCPTGQECVTAGAVMYCADVRTPACVRDVDCGTGRRCIDGTCYARCSVGGASCESPELYCSDDAVCVPDTRPRPFCDASRPCGGGSTCVGGVCRVPCSTSAQCQMVDVTYRNCGAIPNQSGGQMYCLTDNEASASRCARQSDCASGQNCIDGACM